MNEQDQEQRPPEPLLTTMVNEHQVIIATNVDATIDFNSIVWHSRLGAPQEDRYLVRYQVLQPGTPDRPGLVVTEFGELKPGDKVSLKPGIVFTVYKLED